MTTPQKELYNLSNNIKNLTDLFQVDEHEDSIFDKVKQIHMNNEMIVKRIDMLQDQMSLIIKLLKNI